LVACAWIGAPAAATSGEAAKVHALFDEYWAWLKREIPEYATYLGDDRYDDRLTDLSVAAIERRKAYRRALLSRSRNFDASRLTAQDVVSLGIFRSLMAQRAGVEAFPMERLQISPTYGPQLDFASLVKATPFRNAQDYRRYLMRLRALPLQLQQIETLLREGLATGWTAPMAALGRVPEQFDAWIAENPEKSPAWRPFAEYPATIPEAERATLSAEGRRAIGEGVTPAYLKLRRFVETEYLPGARKSLGATALPDGAAYYDALIRASTTTTLSAKNIHEIGLREVDRIDGEMQAVIRQTGFAGSRAEFIAMLRDSPQFYYTRGEDMLIGYRDIAKRVDAQLPKLFAELPRLPYGIRAMEVFEGDNAEHYTEGSAEAGRAGYFEANVNNLKARPKYEMESTFLHEAVPGHHLQTARAQELRGLPEFRRHVFFVGYAEGWALYAESLGDELGVYRDPYTRFGRLIWEQVRACRLVVDTGIHAFGWERARAIDYLQMHSGITESFAIAEIDRYIVQPGQALGYKLGELKIKDLRARATAELGERFDLRRFHNALIDDGAVPLDVLEQRVNAWIAGEKIRIAGDRGRLDAATK
jgi:uncharacterized protein (DUF885 family)